MKLFTSILASLFLIVFSSLSYGQTGNINGTVTDEDQKILKEFTVKLSAAIKPTIDLEKGTFIFTNIPIGTYTIDVKAPGFEVFKSEMITVTEGQTSTVSVSMKTRAQTTGDIRVSGKSDKNKGDVEEYYMWDKKNNLKYKKTLFYNELDLISKIEVYNYISNQLNYTYFRYEKE